MCRIWEWYLHLSKYVSPTSHFKKSVWSSCCINVKGTCMVVMHYSPSLLLYRTAYPSPGTVIQQMLDWEERFRKKIEGQIRTNGNIEKKFPLKQSRGLFSFSHYFSPQIMCLLLTIPPIPLSSCNNVLISNSWCSSKHSVVEEFLSVICIFIIENQNIVLHWETNEPSMNESNKYINTCVCGFACDHFSATRKQNGKIMRRKIEEIKFLEWI